MKKKTIWSNEITTPMFVSTTIYRHVVNILFKRFMKEKHRRLVIAKTASFNTR